MRRVEEGDLVLLYLDERRRYLVKAVPGEVFHTHKGFLNLGDLVGAPIGGSVETSLGARFTLLNPLVRDLIHKGDRLTQVLYPKDIGYVLLQAGVSAGHRVLEAGTGSGALTMALANQVRPGGVVYSYDINAKHQGVARRNLEQAGLASNVEFKIGDITQGVEERDLDAVFLDLATPWRAVGPAWEALAGGGVLVSFSPTIEQAIKTTEELRAHPFVEVETVELLLRRYNVGKNRTRPHTRMIGHSGYLTTARKVLGSHG